MTTKHVALASSQCGTAKWFSFHRLSVQLCIVLFFKQYMQKVDHSVYALNPYPTYGLTVIMKCAHTYSPHMNLLSCIHLSDVLNWLKNA